ncbi:MAG TPA: hypothetical protein DDW41_05090 [Candidatus Andersenbacteria bacterium]|nr:hypothetical protein [Candidatus Andersenbacteria bacterium]
MDRQAFDKRIDFDVNLIAYEGNDDWVEGTLLKIKECLEGDVIPGTGKSCDYCAYWTARADYES